MASNKEDRADSLSPTCTISFFDCWSAPSPREEHQRALSRIGVERDMRIMYQQPHLVPPMKLTVFDDLPPTPGMPPASQLSHWMTQGRNLASRASQRASMSTKKKTARPQIGRPMPFQDGSVSMRGFRPLELSIYIAGNRLSDLPEFDQVDFSTDGAIQVPPRALLRSQSEELLAHFPSIPTPQKSVSMFEERGTVSRRRQDIKSSIISTSRPPSEYDALHSHPVSMVDVSGMQTEIPGNEAITMLSPIEDEVTPLTATGNLKQMGLDLPNSEVQEHSESARSARKMVPTTALAPLKFTFKSRTYSNHVRRGSSSSTSTQAHNQSRVAQWLARSASSSISSSNSASTGLTTITTATTASTSFAEHRKKRSQFYQCEHGPGNQQKSSTPEGPPQRQPPPPPPAYHSHTYTPPPKALNLRSHRHHRTMSASTMASTAETIDTTIMSLDDRLSEMSMTTAPVVQDVSSRSYVSINSGAGRVITHSKPIAMVMSVNEVTKSSPTLGLEQVIHSPPAYEAHVVVAEEGTAVKDLLGGVVRSPGVGVAF